MSVLESGQVAMHPRQWRAKMTNNNSYKVIFIMSYSAQVHVANKCLERTMVLVTVECRVSRPNYERDEVSKN